jgi:hypothetical protein
MNVRLRSLAFQIRVDVYALVVVGQLLVAVFQFPIQHPAGHTQLRPHPDDGSPVVFSDLPRRPKSASSHSLLMMLSPPHSSHLLPEVILSSGSPQY